MSTDGQQQETPTESVERANVANILRKLQSGKVLTQAEKDTVIDWQAKHPPAPEQPIKGLSARQREFAGLVATGMSHVDAYKRVYKPSKNRQHTFYATQSYRISQRPGVKEYITLLQGKSEGKKLLTLNDRLGILARDAQLPGNGPAMVNARARVIEVYNKTSGDAAPDRSIVEVKNPAGETFVTTTRPMTKAEKLAGMRAKRAPDKQPPLPSVTPP